MSIVDTNEQPSTLDNTGKSEKSVRTLTYLIVGGFIVGMIIATAAAVWFLLSISATTVFK